MAEEKVCGQCMLLARFLRSCKTSRELPITTTLEDITQPSLSEMFAKCQYPDFGNKERGLVVRCVGPQQFSASHLQASFDSYVSRAQLAHWLRLVSSQSNA